MKKGSTATQGFQGSARRFGPSAQVSVRTAPPTSTTSGRPPRRRAMIRAPTMASTLSTTTPTSTPVVPKRHLKGASPQNSSGPGWSQP